MSSSEEYLDNLLKSLLEGEGDETEGTSSSATDMTDMSGGTPEGSPSAGEHNKAMSTDDIEAMFAAMGQNTSSDDPGISMESAEIVDQQDTVQQALDESMLSDDLTLDKSLLSDELTLDESMLPDDLALDESLLSDELTLDESMLSDDLVLDESMLPEDLALDESMLSDDLTLDESILPDTLAMEESGLPDGLALEEGELPDELVLDESMLPEETALEESTLPDDLALDESELPDELALDESELPDELALDESELPDELALDESKLPDELALDESMLPDELALDESMLPEELTLDDGMLSEESPMDDFALEENMLPEEEMQADDFALEENTEEEAGSDALTLDDLGLDDLGLEMADQGETGMMDDESGMSEDDIDRLLGGDLLSGESAGQPDDLSDDSDLSALLAGMGEDEDLSEINDLLEKSDQGMAVDDDMLAMLDGAANHSEDDDAFGFFGGEEGGQDDIREITPEELAAREGLKSKKQKKKEEKERKKQEKLAKKAAKKADKNGETQEETEDELNSLLDSMKDTEEEPKKQGFWARFLAFLLEADDDEDELVDDADADMDDAGAMLGNLSDENKELLAELKAEDKKNAKKKDKKGKKGKKGKKDDEAAAEGEGEEGADAKPKKQKKEKKKKEKDKKEDDVLKAPEKKLSKKKVFSVFLFCATIAACIIVVTTVLPEQLEKQEARVAFDHAQYEQVYEQLYGRELSEEDELLLQKSSVILQMKRKLDSYDNYTKMDMPMEALNALLEGVNRYQNLRDDAELYHVGNELNDIYGQILDALAGRYGLSESDALDILASGDDVTYSQRLRSIIYGDISGDGEGDAPENKQDVLPEEEEIIDRLQNTDEIEDAENNEIM